MLLYAILSSSNKRSSIECKSGLLVFPWVLTRRRSASPLASSVASSLVPVTYLFKLCNSSLFLTLTISQYHGCPVSGARWQVVSPEPIHLRSLTAAGPLVCSAWHKASYLFAYAGPRLGICFQGKCPVFSGSKPEPNSLVVVTRLIRPSSSESSSSPSFRPNPLRACPFLLLSGTGTCYP